MSSKVRIGVIGTSGMADYMYLPSLRSHPQAELVAICGRNRERAEQMAAKYHIPQVFTDYGAMITQAGLDAIIVGAPDDLHYEMTMRALGAGLHVLCEKPLALTAKQAWEMYQTAEKAKRKHMVFFTYRWMPFFRYLRDLIDQGYIGHYYHCEFRYLMGGGRKKEYRWRFDRKRANGTLADMGVHMIDMARWLVDDIVRVSAQLGVFVDRPGADGGPIDPANDSAFLLTEFANGAHGMIHASPIAHVADRSMQQQVMLYGEEGSLELDVQYEGAEAGVVLHAARAQEEQMQRLEVPAGYWGGVSWAQAWDVFTQQSASCRSFVDAILEDSPATPNFYHGYKAQQVIEAALEADRSGNWVTIKNPT